MSDDRQYAPATLRNRDFILDVLRDVLPMTGVILEIASGSGEHIVHFARNFPPLVFQPSDPEPDALLSIAAWVKVARVTNVRAPIALDASQSVWPIASADGVICINMVHISPWEATIGLIKGAAAILAPASPFYLYGPYIREGFATAPSNQAFDRSLRHRNPNWGLRDLELVAATAQSVRLYLWRQGRTRQNRFAELRRRGVAKFPAAVQLVHQPGSGACPDNPAVQHALRNNYFESLRLPQIYAPEQT
jgi:Protein of unknown function (DUF938)